jgi:hypothetical protein
VHHRSGRASRIGRRADIAWPHSGGWPRHRSRAGERRRGEPGENVCTLSIISYLAGVFRCLFPSDVGSEALPLEPVPSARRRHTLHSPRASWLTSKVTCSRSPSSRASMIAFSVSTWIRRKSCWTMACASRRSSPIRSAGGRRSMRAASTAWTVGGTSSCSPCSAWIASNCSRKQGVALRRLQRAPSRLLVD